MGTKKGQRRKTARRAYESAKGPAGYKRKQWRATKARAQTVAKTYRKRGWNARVVKGKSFTGKPRKRKMGYWVWMRRKK